MQLRVAAGEPLPFGQDQVRLDGHAIEARVYAEDPARGFLPTGGTVLALREPRRPGVRVDSGLAVGTDGDQCLRPDAGQGHRLGHGPRPRRCARLDAALADTVDPRRHHQRRLPAGPARPPRRGRRPARHRPDRAAPGSSWPVSTCPTRCSLPPPWPIGSPRKPTGPVVDPWDIPDGWRPGEPAWTRLRLVCAAHSPTEVRVRGRAGLAAEVAVGEAEPVVAWAELSDGDLLLSYSGRTLRYACAWLDGHPHRGPLWLGRGGQTWAIRQEQRLTPRGEAARSADGIVTSPMPGTVVAVHITEGQQVTSGEPLLIIEAMKMEHTVTAPLDGTVAELKAKAGQQVAMDETLAIVRAR